MSRPSLTLEHIKNKSKSIYGENFIIYGIRVLNGHSQIDLECSSCGYRLWVRASRYVSETRICRKCNQWTLDKVRQESNRIHGDKFTVLNIEYKTTATDTKIRSYVHLLCNICDYSYWTRLDNHTGVKCECKQCSKRVSWTKEKAQEESNRIHNHIFIIHDIRIKCVGIQKLMKRSFLLIECRVCNYRNWVSVNNHINKMQGCDGVCNIKGQRKSQIETLQTNDLLANRPYNLYFLKFTHKITNEQFYKIGKTKNTVNFRFSSKEYSNYIIEICQVVGGTHLWVAEQELEFINKYKKYQYKPKENFKGWTECFKPEISGEF